VSCAPRGRSKASSARGLPTECLTTEWPHWKKQAQRKGSTGKGLIQSNSSGLLKRLPHQALLQQLADRQPAQIGRADPGRTRQFVELAPALRLQLDFKSRRGVVCHAAKIRPPAEFPFNAPAFRRRSDAAQRPWQLRRCQKRAPAGAEAKVVLTPEAASHARHQHPYMARQLDVLPKIKSNGRRVSVHWFAGVLQSLCSPSLLQSASGR
jgi:hypothetical protein